MMMERIWRWLGVATVADLYQWKQYQFDEMNRAVRARGRLKDRIEALEQMPTDPLLRQRAKSLATDEPRTGNGTTPTCENIDSEGAVVEIDYGDGYVERFEAKPLDDLKRQTDETRRYCSRCGMRFTPLRTEAIYCSPACEGAA